MKKLIFFSTAFVHFFCIGAAYGAEAKKPVPKAKFSQEAKSPETI
jgi:hypothetical protein